MLFNSYEFIFVFLPATLVVFFALGTVSRPWALRWIIAASLLFYARWRPQNVLIIGPAIAVNYLLARALERLVKQEHRAAARGVLTAGIAFNILFLGYFKYAAFTVGAANDAFGTEFALLQIVLPLGISFITFQKIAFLIDVHARRVESFTFQDFCLFVLFFPQLIAGPIVHYREMMPQFKRASCVLDSDNLSVGVTLFVIGVFKKVCLADGISPFVASLFDQAASGGTMAFLPAWMAALGFTFQIYFDFSGYTDMALGIARAFGIRLPPNFDSPLRASSIIEFWLRWHMTLTRFLTAYVYNPLVLSLTRRRLAQGRGGISGRKTTIGAFVELLAFPTLLTMFVSGVWHGAGYLFILWGVLHGVFLVVNHAWRLMSPVLWPDRTSYERVMRPAGFVLTLVAVTTSMVLFRSSTVQGASRLFQGMLGLHGVGLPATVAARLGPFAGRLLAGDPQSSAVLFNFSLMVLWLLLLGFVAFICPNSLQLLARHDPALGWQPRPGKDAPIPALTWNPSLAWAVVVSIIAAVGFLNLGGQSEFLYWQF